jgi:hypothetical protein
MKAGLAGDKRLLHVNAPHSKGVFRATIRGMSNGSAPGGSSMSYAVMHMHIVHCRLGLDSVPIASLLYGGGYSKGLPRDLGV